MCELGLVDPNYGLSAANGREVWSKGEVDHSDRLLDGCGLLVFTRAIGRQRFGDHTVAVSPGLTLLTLRPLF